MLMQYQSHFKEKRNHFKLYGFTKGVMSAYYQNSKVSFQSYISLSALKYLGKAVDLQEEVLPPPEYLIHTHEAMSVVLLGLGRKEEAEDEMKRAVECAKKSDSWKAPLETLEIYDSSPIERREVVHPSCVGEPFEPEESSTDGLQMHEVIPSYVWARGAIAVAAYQRALANGKTPDKRVKVMLVGQARVGKNSVTKALKGEPFNPEESSTDGVQMHGALKNVGIQPWKNFTIQEETTTYHHKCAEFISRDLLTELTEVQELMTTPELSKPPEKPNDQVKDDGPSDIQTDRGLETGLR